jgi:hypothetical protein
MPIVRSVARSARCSCTVFVMPASCSSYFFAERLELEHSLERCGNAVSLLRFVHEKSAHLPRQARDKHTRTLNRRRFCRVESVELHGDGSLTHSLKREREDEALLLAAGLDPATQQSHPALVRSLLLQAEALRLKARGQQGAIVAELAKRTEASLRLLQPAEPRTEIAAAETMRTIAEQFAPPPPPPDRHDAGAGATAAGTVAGAGAGAGASAGDDDRDDAATETATAASSSSHSRSGGGSLRRPRSGVVAPADEGLTVDVLSPEAKRRLRASQRAQRERLRHLSPLQRLQFRGIRRRAVAIGEQAVVSVRTVTSGQLVPLSRWTK